MKRAAGLTLVLVGPFLRRFYLLYAVSLCACVCVRVCACVCVCVRASLSLFTENTDPIARSKQPNSTPTNEHPPHNERKAADLTRDTASTLRAAAAAMARGQRDAAASARRRWEEVYEAMEKA